MLIISPAPSTTPQRLELELARRGFAPSVVPVEATDVRPAEYLITGSSLSRKDEYGGPAQIGEEDRALVEGVVAELDTRRQDMARVRTLREKPTMTTPELTEAVKLLLKYVEEG